MATKAGVITPQTEAKAPFVPASFLPVNIAVFMAITPGKLVEIA